MVETVPDRSTSILSNGLAYLDMVDAQFQYFLDQYGVFANQIRNQILGKQETGNMLLLWSKIKRLRNLRRGSK